MPSWGRGYANYGAHERPIVGDTKTSAVTADHIGWLKCDGRLLNPSEFQDLFKVIGYSFGSAGPLFRIPDPAGRVLGYAGTPNAANPSLTARTMGGLSGEETHVLTVGELAEHRHTGTTDSNGSHDHGGSTGAAGQASESENVEGGTGATVTGSGSHTHSISTDGAHTHTFTSNYTGGNDPHNNIQPTVWIGNLFIYSGKTGFNRSGTYSGAFPNTPDTNLY